MSLFDDMTVFVRAVEAESFSGAAQRLGVAKSVVSRRMASLEGRLGTSLFHRTTRRLSLTETGHAYYERARRILADVAEAEDVARRLQSELRGKLKVAAPMSFGLMHLSPAVTEFLVAHPQLEIELDLNDRRVDLVSEGHDLAIRIGKLPDSSLIARRLAPCRHVVCASPAYLQIRGEPPSPECLETISEEWRFRIGGEWRSVRVSAKRLGVNNGDVLRDAAIAGLGLVALPTFIVNDAIQRGELKSVLRDYDLDDPSIHAVCHPTVSCRQRSGPSSISSASASAGRPTGMRPCLRRAVL